MDSLIRDVRFAWSLLLRRRAATAVTVVSLALGIGANVTVFGVANAARAGVPGLEPGPAVPLE